MTRGWEVVSSTLNDVRAWGSGYGSLQAVWDSTHSQKTRMYGAPGACRRSKCLHRKVGAMEHRSRIGDIKVRMTAAAVLLAMLCSVAATKEAHGQSFTVFHDFNGTAGSQPMAGLATDAAGNFYGTTEYGGILNCDSGGVPGCGVAYKLRRVNSGRILFCLVRVPWFRWQLASD